MTHVGPGTRTGLLTLLDQGVISAMSFATTVIVARATSREGLGIYYLALTLTYLARGVQTQIIFAPYTIYCHRRTGRASATYAGSVLIHQGAMLAIAAAGLAVAAGVLSTGVGPAGLAAVMAVLIAALPLLLLREFNRNFSLAHLDAANAIAADVLLCVLQLGGLGLLWYFHVMSIPAVFGVMAGACAVSCTGWFFVQKHPWRFNVDRVVADWRQNWHFGRWALASNLVGSTAPHVMPWILAAVHGEASVGLLGACGTLVGLVNVFVMGVSNYLSPKTARAFANEGKAGLIRVVRKATLVYLAVVGGFCLLTLAAGDRLVTLVYGSRFAGGGHVLAVLAVSVLAISMGIVAGCGLWAMDRPRLTFITDVAGMAVTIAVGVACIPAWGAIGAAAATTAGLAASAAMKWILLLRTLRAE